jgi:hypothetical protein
MHGEDPGGAGRTPFRPKVSFSPPKVPFFGRVQFSMFVPLLLETPYILGRGFLSEMCDVCLVCLAGIYYKIFAKYASNSW